MQGEERNNQPVAFQVGRMRHALKFQVAVAVAFARRQLGYLCLLSHVYITALLLAEIANIVGSLYILVFAHWSQGCLCTLFHVTDAEMMLLMACTEVKPPSSQFIGEGDLRSFWVYYQL